MTSISKLGNYYYAPAVNFCSAQQADVSNKEPNKNITQKDWVEQVRKDIIIHDPKSLQEKEETLKDGGKRYTISSDVQSAVAVFDKNGYLIDDAEIDNETHNKFKELQKRLDEKESQMGDEVRSAERFFGMPLQGKGMLNGALNRAIDNNDVGMLRTIIMGVVKNNDDPLYSLVNFENNLKESKKYQEISNR